MYNQSRDGYRRPPQTDVLAVLDGYEEYMTAGKGEKPAEVDLRVRLVFSLIKAHGPSNRILAVVHEDDKLRQAAYKRLGCVVQPMNGDRPIELMNLIGDEVDQMIQNPPRKLIIMGGDAAYGPLCALAHSRESEVLVWPLNGHTVAPQLKPYAQQSLEDLLPDLRAETAMVTVKIDAENHLYSLHKVGLRVDTKTYVTAVLRAVADLGDVASIQATADWKRLRETLGHDCQWEFEDNGVRTDYRRNIPGKNTSDLALAGSIHESLERDPKIDIYVLGTGDSDFTPVVEAIHSRGKQVYVIGLRASMSRKLEELADGVRYLDDFLAAPTRAPAAAPTGQGGASASALSVEELATLLQVTDFLGRQHWAFAYFNRLPESVDKAQVRSLVDRGVMRPRAAGERNTAALAPNDPLAQQAQLLLHVLRRQLHFWLVQKQWAYVDTNRLALDMQADPRCQTLQLGQTRADVETWLEAAKLAGLVVKERRPNPKNPQREVDTWLPRVGQGVAASSPLEPANTAAAEAVPRPHRPGDEQTPGDQPAATQAVLSEMATTEAAAPQTTDAEATAPSAEPGAQHTAQALGSPTGGPHASGNAQDRPRDKTEHREQRPAPTGF